MTAYAAAVVLKDPEGLDVDMPLSRYNPKDAGTTLVVTIVNDDGTAFDVSINGGRAMTSESRQPTPREQALANVFRHSSTLMHGFRPAQQVDQFLYHWQHGEPPPEPRSR